MVLRRCFRKGRPARIRRSPLPGYSRARMRQRSANLPTTSVTANSDCPSAAGCRSARPAKRMYWRRVGAQERSCWCAGVLEAHPRGRLYRHRLDHAGPFRILRHALKPEAAGREQGLERRQLALQPPASMPRSIMHQHVPAVRNDRMRMRHRQRRPRTRLRLPCEASGGSRSIHRGLRSRGDHLRHRFRI